VGGDPLADEVRALLPEDDPPCVSLRPGLTIPGTTLCWRRFVETAPPDDLKAAILSLKRLRE
jgi:hypothetical protein